jgi:hypothetical protein
MNHAVKSALALCLLAAAGTANAYCTVYGVYADDPYGDAQLVHASGVADPALSVDPLDVRSVFSCFDAAADEFEYHIEVANLRTTIPPWSEWILQINFGTAVTTAVYVEAYAGPGGELLGYRMFRQTWPLAGGAPYVECLGSVSGRVSYNTFVMRVPRQKLDAAAGADDYSSLHTLTFDTGVSPAPRTLGHSECQLPRVFADSGGGNS